MDFLSCENAHLTTEQVMSALVTKTSEGDWGIRTMLVEACSENAVDCSNNAIPFDTQFKKCIGISAECSLPALRLGISKEALATHLGLAYANNAAAKTALGAAGFQFYNTTTNAWAITV